MDIRAGKGSGQEPDGFQLITNAASSGTNLLSVIKSQLSSLSPGDSFDFCVAFVTEGGLQTLVDVLAELKRRGVHGRMLTSTYQNFNPPSVYRKLLSYPNIETRVYQGNMHAKGYLFNRDGASTVIIGSSNLTQQALTLNKEWNVLFQTPSNSTSFATIKNEFESLWGDGETAILSEDWIEGYESYWLQDAPASKNRLDTYHVQDADIALQRTAASSASTPVTPNKMQRLALEALEVIHARNEPRALLVSATGTGKTYLSAFDVQAVRPKRVLFLAHRDRILKASMASYKKLLGGQYNTARYESGSDVSHATCVFAMCSTMVRHLDEFDPHAFDYIIIDEAHRTGSGTYQKIMEYFKPAFYLGMTATPNRTDGYDVFALFNHVIAFQITLQDALENDMLAPFHYFGIADLHIDDEAIDDLSMFSKLTSDERVKHITQKIEEYTVDPRSRRGLIFCNRNDEARVLSEKFNELGYRTVALSGANSNEERDAAIERLERGKLEYIFSVDIFNEGVDIPSLNQIIMLRRTESPIVFVQQLGRGLRKDDGKEYALILDFIGNYQRNFFIPVALSGDHTYNKDNLRKTVEEGSSIVPGCSTVSFDEVSKARIYRAIDEGSFNSAKFIKNEYLDLRQKLGRVPALEEFDRNGAIDPLLIFQKFDSYHAFLSKYEADYDVEFTKNQCSALKFISTKLANGKRFEELFLLRELVENHDEKTLELIDAANREYRKQAREPVMRSAASVLYGNFSSSGDFFPLVIVDENGYSLTKDFAEALLDDEFKRQVLEVVDFGLSRHYASYGDSYKGTSFVLNAKYTYEEVCRLLGWKKNVNGQNLGGYKYDEDTNTFPVFINYDKDPGISETIKYEDRFVSDRELIAISKQPRSLSSPEIQRLREWPENEMKIYLFVRKNKDDKVSKEFYFLGEMYPTQHYEPITIAGKSAVEITYQLDQPVRYDIYAFLTGDMHEDEQLEEPAVSD